MLIQKSHFEVNHTIPSFPPIMLCNTVVFIKAWGLFYTEGTFCEVTAQDTGTHPVLLKFTDVCTEF